MVKSRGLGKGLDALFANPKQIVGSSQADGFDLPVEVLVPGKYQPRSHLDEVTLQELANSIEAQGLIQPIIVRSIVNNQFEIIAGERRWRAAKLAGLKKVPVIIKKVSDSAVISMALIENIQREDLNPIEQALGIRRLIEEFNLTHEEASKSVGKSRSAISNLLRLLTLDKAVQAFLAQKKLEMGHARSLIPLGKIAQKEMANKIIKMGLSVRETELLVNNEKKVESKGPNNLAKSRDLVRLEDELSQLLDMNVKVGHNKNGSGFLRLKYATLDQMDMLIEKLRS